MEEITIVRLLSRRQSYVFFFFTPPALAGPPPPPRRDEIFCRIDPGTSGLIKTLCSARARESCWRTGGTGTSDRLSYYSCPDGGRRIRFSCVVR